MSYDENDAKFADVINAEDIAMDGKLLVDLIPEINNFKLFAKLSVTLDPKDESCAGMIEYKKSGILTIDGLWKAGEDHRWLGPTGDSNIQFRGMNKWCAIVIMRKSNGEMVKFAQYPGKPVLIKPMLNPHAIITVLMNDELDRLIDNENHPDRPMSSTLTIQH